MSDGIQGNALSLGAGGAVASITFKDREDEARVRALLDGKGGSPLNVELAADASADVEGHAASTSVELTLRLEDDDVSGHAISVHFPTSQDAARFRRNLIAGGILVSTLAIGSAGAIVISSQAQAPAPPLPATPAYERPAGVGPLEGVDMGPLPAPAPLPAVITEAPAIDAVTGQPSGTGLLEGSDGAVTGPATETTNLPPGTGLLEGVDK